MKKWLNLIMLILLFSNFSFAQSFYLGDNSTNCNSCHGPVVAGWHETKHSIAQDSIASLQFTV